MKACCTARNTLRLRYVRERTDRTMASRSDTHSRRPENAVRRRSRHCAWINQE